MMLRSMQHKAQFRLSASFADDCALNFAVEPLVGHVPHADRIAEQCANETSKASSGSVLSLARAVRQLLKA